MQKSNAVILLEFLLEAGAKEPLPRRVELYRAAAVTIADEAAAAALLEAAKDLEAAYRRLDQLVLNLNAPAEGGDGAKLN